MDINKLKLVAKRKGACNMHMRLLESVHSYDDAVHMSAVGPLVETKDILIWISFLVDHNIVPMSFVYARDAARDDVWKEYYAAACKAYDLGVKSGTITRYLAERLLNHKILRAQKARHAKFAAIDAKFLADVRAHLEALPNHAFDETKDLNQ